MQFADRNRNKYKCDFNIEHHEIRTILIPFCSAGDRSCMRLWYVLQHRLRPRYLRLQPLRVFPVPSYTQATSAYQAAKNTGLETTIDIHYNDFYCIDIQKELGVDYLYPDQKYTIWATSPRGP